MELPRPAHVINEGAAFLLELLALAALCWWGFQLGGAVGVVIGLAAPLLAAVAWALFAAPTARIRLPLPAVHGVKLLVFAAGTLALVGVHHPTLAIIFAALDADSLLARTRAEQS